MSTFAELFRNGENKAKFPIGYTNETSNYPLVLEQDDLYNCFYLLMHYKNKETNSITLLDSKFTVDTTESHDIVSKKVGKLDNDDEHIIEIMKSLKELIDNNNIILLPVKNINDWFLIFRDTSQKWHFIDSNATPNTNLGFAQKIVKQFNNTDVIENDSYADGAKGNTGFYTILYMLAAATMTPTEINLLRNDTEISKKFLREDDLTWIKKEIQKLYNLRYQVDAALTGPMKKIVVTASKKTKPDFIKVDLKKLKEEFPTVLFLFQDTNESVYDTKSYKLKVFLDNKVVNYEITNIENPPKVNTFTEFKDIIDLLKK